MNNSSLNVKEKQEKRRIRKICLLILSITITGIVLIVETYAWFVGISTVNVDNFQVSISGEDGLELSLNASNWSSSTLTIDSTAVTTGLSSTYSSHKNKWIAAGGSMIPVSSSGDIDTNTSRLKLFGKGSLASTQGGYGLVSSQISNGSTEDEGYIAFDLFIRNGTKDAYDATYDADADEAIYLSRGDNSSVKFDSAGSGDENYGVENSIRIAFAQIGRVKSGTAAATAQGITCTGNTTVTSLCTNAGTTIWEPNDTAHKTNLINYYNLACKQKVSPTTYTSNNCGTLTNGTFFPTYTVKKNITTSNHVDIYDGSELNGYTSSIGSSSFLDYTDTFTDTEKNGQGDARPVFMKLAANSVTKVRVYIYLEGQDVDNYDLITKGKQIKIKFGLTKDKFEINT